MSKPDYTALDAELLKLIKAGRNTFHSLFRRPSRLLNMATPFVKKEYEEWRVIDRRLRALRRAGKIVFRKPGGWVTINREQK